MRACRPVRESYCAFVAHAIIGCVNDVPFANFA